MKLIIIEDDKKLLFSLKNNLISNNFKVDGVLDGKSGLELIKLNNYDLIILDLNLPDISGAKICETIRDNQIKTPLLIISGDNKIASKIDLLDLGADDYLEKPFSILEIVARIKALLRRPASIINSIIKIDDLELDKEKQTLKMSNKKVYLTKKEFLLLEYFMNSPNKVISRDELMEHLWDMKANLFSKTIEMHMVNLRKKIDNHRKIPLIKTISGRGYKFN